MSKFLELLAYLLQRFFPDKVSSLRGGIADWYRGAVERAALRKKEVQDGQKKPD
jgi:hypothetical protein